MKIKSTRSYRVTTDQMFADLGFTNEEAAELEIKSDIFLAIRRVIDAAGHTQRDLCRILDEHQPQVSNLVNGRSSKFSIDKLLRYASRLGLKTTVKIQAASSVRPKTRAKAAA